MANDYIEVEAGKTSMGESLREALAYKRLFLVFLNRDFRVKYAKSALGVAWAFLRPFLFALVLTTVFSVVTRIPTGETPFALHILTGLASFMYFSSLLNGAGNSLSGAKGIIKKIYFPKLIFPAVQIVVNFIDFIILLFFVFVLMIWYQVPLSSHFFLFPAAVALLVISGSGLALLVSALTVQYDDFFSVLPVGIRMLLYLSPVIYPIDMVPEEFLWPYHLNPLAGAINLLRYSLIDTYTLPIQTWLSVAVAVVVFALGLRFFQRTENTIADHL